MTLPQHEQSRGRRASLHPLDLFGGVRNSLRNSGSTMPECVTEVGVTRLAPLPYVFHKC